RICTGLRAPQSKSSPLYCRVLGEAFEQMPAPWRAMHELHDELIAEGVARVERGTGLLATLVARLIGFPNAARDVPVRVTFTLRDGVETWLRQFAERRFSSTQQEGRGRYERLLVETFGPFRFGLALVIDDGRMRLVVRRWSFLGLPLPRAWTPIG